MEKKEEINERNLESIRKSPQLLADLGIKGDFEGIGHVALGYVDEGGVKPAAPRKENYVYWVK